MVRDEFTNVKGLLRVWFKAGSRNYKWFFIIIAILFFGSLSISVFGILQDGPAVRHHAVTDFSGSFIFGIVIGFIIMLFMYRSHYAKWSVFPQTNNSRFVAALIANHIVVIGVALCALVMYLLSYFVLLLLSYARDGVYFALEFNVGFLVALFFAFLAYCVLICSIIELIGTIFRKWTIYAAVAFVAVFALMVANFTAVVEFAPRILSFLTREPSLAMFFLKAAGLWVVLTAASFVINHFTVYHKSRSRTMSKSVVIVCVAIALVVLIVVPVILFNVVSSGENILVSETSLEPSEPPYASVTESVEDLYTESVRVRVDVSHLPKGSSLKIDGVNINVVASGIATVFTASEYSAYISGTDALENLQADTLVLRFLKPWYNVNGIDIFKYADPRLDAYMDGDTLVINYSFDNANVVILPIWGIIRQFDLFRDRGLFTLNQFGYSMGGSRNPNIHIGVE